MPTPIALFVYNRPQHSMETVEHLLRNKMAGETQLYVFSDGAKREVDGEKVKKIREYFRGLEGFARVELVESPSNKGLRQSVKDGIDHVLAAHDTVIAVEDDVCVNGNFLEYHNACLARYLDQKGVWSISGYVVPGLGQSVERETGQQYFLARRASSWGWSTWKDRWDRMMWDEAALKRHLFTSSHLEDYRQTGGDKVRMLFNKFEGKIDSWAILWDYCHFMNNGLCLYPSRSFVRNTGNDYSGTHTKPLPDYDVKLDDWEFQARDLPAQPQPDGRVDTIFRQINKKFYRDIYDWYRKFRLKPQL